MHARIQTWFPFAIQICLNGREWRARTMGAAGFKSFRTPEGKPDAPQGWHGMRKGVADPCLRRGQPPPSH